jgi:hypothetical protein
LEQKQEFGIDSSDISTENEEIDASENDNINELEISE